MVSRGVLALVLAVTASPTTAQDTGPRGRLEAAAATSIGGPATAPAQQEQDRLRRLEDSRLPSVDRFFDPFEAAKEEFREETGLALSFDYQALYQRASNSLTEVDDGAAGHLRLLGTWTLFDRGGSNPGSLVFILENRHKLGLNQTPAGLAGEIGYAGLTGLTFGDTGNSLSVAYWSQKIFNGAGGIVLGRIDPADFLDILGYVNPRTGFQNFGINYNPVLAVPDPGFGFGGGAYLTDQFYALAIASDANGSLTDIEWFPGGSEFFKYAEVGWSPARDQRYLTNIHLGYYHVDERVEAGVPSSSGYVISANHTFANDLMIFGRYGQSDGDAPIARESGTAGLIWRPGFYDDLFGIAVTVAELVDPTLPTQTTTEAFYRLDLADNMALTADVQYLNNPGFNDQDPLVFGLRFRINL